MPHFVVDCAMGLLRHQDEEEIIMRLHNTINATGLFEESDIKIRVNPYAIHAAGGVREDFVHVFSWIMQGRSLEQRANLSRVIVSELSELFPQVPRIAANIAEFEKATYFNRTML
ncbi:5-carboxymethyl-2-hydroxymuconate Delta-isomerase [[Pseudomonas] boreopolis]|uniref:5-carboxymethyl-2-hydroxymuconate Delta-isomerase n=1 Tax=Xanthomonas boreopolis TaxID=86183 RepID=UPI003D49D9E7